MTEQNNKTDLSRAIITMDGPAGAGKSSLAKMMAEKLHLRQLDSGAIYRAYTLITMRYAGLHNDQDLAGLLTQAHFLEFLGKQVLRIEFPANKQVIFYNEDNLEEEIRTAQVTANIKFLAEKAEVRELVNRQIRQIAQNFGIIADGRDMGTAVFPHADLKFFVTASLEVRAQRRLKEFRQKQHNIELAEVMRQIEQRDFEDENREIGPLKMADDAIILDTTFLSLESALEALLQHVRGRFAS